MNGTLHIYNHSFFSKNSECLQPKTIIGNWLKQRTSLCIFLACDKLVNNDKSNIFIRLRVLAIHEIFGDNILIFVVFLKKEFKEGRFCWVSELISRVCLNVQLFILITGVYLFNWRMLLQKEEW